MLLQKTPRKLFTVTTTIDLKFTIPADKSTDCQFLSQGDPSQIEALYNRAAEDFETHNDSWKYTGGSYTKFTDEQWKNQILTFVQNLLRTTDLQEFVAALQDIAAMPNNGLARFLDEAIDDQRVSIHHSDDGKVETVHILSQFEQLEELVEDADFTFLNPLSVTWESASNWPSSSPTI